MDLFFPLDRHDGVVMVCDEETATAYDAFRGRWIGEGLADDLPSRRRIELVVGRLLQREALPQIPSAVVGSRTSNGKSRGLAAALGVSLAVGAAVWVGWGGGLESLREPLDDILGGWRQAEPPSATDPAFALRGRWDGVEDANGLLALMQEDPSKAKYTLSRRVAAGVMVLSCDLEQAVITRILQFPSGAQAHWSWRGDVLDRLRNAAQGKGFDLDSAERSQAASDRSPF